MCLVSVALCIIALSLGDVSALTSCYNCDTNTTMSCGENFNSAGIPICMGNSCTKRFQGVTGQNPHIIRGCSDETSNTCSSTNVIYEWATCTCTGALCNTATSQNGMVYSWIAMTAASLCSLKYLTAVWIPWSQSLICKNGTNDEWLRLQLI